MPVPGRAERTSLKNGVDHLVGDRHLAHEALRHHQLLGGQDRLERALLVPVVANSMRRSESASG